MVELQQTTQKMRTDLGKNLDSVWSTTTQRFWVTPSTDGTSLVDGITLVAETWWSSNNGSLKRSVRTLRRRLWLQNWSSTTPRWYELRPPQDAPGSVEGIALEETWWSKTIHSKDDGPCEDARRRIGAPRPRVYELRPPLDVPSCGGHIIRRDMVELQFTQKIRTDLRRRWPILELHDPCV